MILTVCLSPCIDVTIELDSINVGKVNILKSKTLSFTGKALNVAVGVSRLGGEPYATGFMYNENGMQFEQALDREGVPFTFVWNNGSVRENYKFIDNKAMLTEINGISEPIEEAKLYELSHMVQGISQHASVVVISGGLPIGVNPDYYEALFRTVNPNAKKIVDTEGAKMFAALNAGVDLVKPNLEELEESLGKEFHSKEEMLEGCRELIKRGAKMVLLSLGRDGAILTDGQRSYYCKSLSVAVNSTVGAGDAMVAAVAMQMEQNADMPEILRAGVAAGTASVTTFGGISFRREKYEEIYSALTVTEI
ncbi:MAG: 1-phosphofructokinase family hexose kinase [Christensenellaceae bacterium]